MSQAAAPNSAASRAIPRKTFLGLLAGAIALLAAAGISAWLVVPGLVSEQQADQADAEEAVIAAKTAIQLRFTDAQSITYGAVSTNWLGDSPVICGRVDVVQDEDSFDGMERFVFADGQLSIEEVDGSPFVQQKWNDACKAA